ncbi:MAG: hypothetical protein RL385_4011 [Pseudomonadota bacterium]
MDFGLLASEITKTLRGQHSQTAHSKWLGCKSNVSYAWESGRAAPTAAEALQIFKRRGTDLPEAYRRFYQREPPWLDDLQPESPEGVAAFLADLKGRTTVLELARTMKQSRFTVARWLSGQTAIKLPQFLQLIQVTSLRLLDFLAVLLDPTRLPSVRDAWINLENTRRAAYDMPWSQAVLRALELDSYKALPSHRAGWIANLLSLDPKTEELALTLLRDSGQVIMKDGHYEPVQVSTTDTRSDPERAWRSRAFWSRAALERLEARVDGLYWHNVFGVSEADYERIRQLQAWFFREARAIIAQSEPVERVVLMNLQLIPLSTRTT